MAIRGTVTTDAGEERELYIRLNNMEASNHGVLSQALFRGFISKKAFQAGKAYVWERSVDFEANPDGKLWQQAYEALKAERALDDEGKPTDEPLVRTEDGADDDSVE